MRGPPCEHRLGGLVPGLPGVHRANEGAFGAHLRWNLVVTHTSLYVFGTLVTLSLLIQNKSLETGVAALYVWLNCKVCKSSKKPHKIKTVFANPVPHGMFPQALDEVAGSWWLAGI